MGNATGGNSRSSVSLGQMQWLVFYWHVASRIKAAVVRRGSQGATNVAQAMTGRNLHQRVSRWKWVSSCEQLAQQKQVRRYGVIG